MVISIEKAAYLGDFKISFVFSDKKRRILSFKKFLETSKNPMIKKFLNESYFKNFKIEYGDIQWNDYELCFPIWDIYEGKI